MLKIRVTAAKGLSLPLGGESSSVSFFMHSAVS